MKIQQRVSMKYSYAHCNWNGLEIEDESDNKILISMTDDQWLDLAERLDAKREHILEKRKEKLEDANSDSE
jgi:hypothetical protein